MAFIWNKHRFSGESLIFDLVNTVACRRTVNIRDDRLTDLGAATHFANAALVFRQEEIRLHTKDHRVDCAEFTALLDLREVSYEHFLSVCEGRNPSYTDLGKLLNLIADALNNSRLMPFATDVAMSALHQISHGRRSRVKACPNCDWLFLDKSKNNSRIWCDMSVCGNRQKARKSYLKRSSLTESEKFSS